MDFPVSITEAASASDTSNFAYAAPLTPSTFRAQYPAFKDTVVYPDAQIALYIGVAYKFLSADRWGSTLDFGASLFTAHFVALDRLAQMSPGMAGIPGAAVGVITGGTVDKVSFQRDVKSVMEENAGHWGMTIYGLQYLRFARLMGAGPVQVGVGDYAFPQSAAQYSGAWPGPFATPYSN